MDAKQKHSPPQTTSLERRIQIEEALERVRARAMAMYHSDDILSVTGSMFDEYRKLDMPMVRCGIGIVHDITDGEAWATTYTPKGAVVQVTGHVSFLESPTYRALYDAWQRQEKWYVFELEGEQLKQFLLAIYPNLPVSEYSGTFPEKQFINYFGFAQGGLYTVGGEPLSDADGLVLQRFAEVFHLTYTRYQDLKNLESTQAQLLHSEKMASLGQLTSGIAHEIKNPLNFVNNFSQISLDLIRELNEWVDIHGSEEQKHTLAMLQMNIEKIMQHGIRADGIVKSMMQHASGGTGEREQVAINVLLEEYITLAFHSWPGKESLIRMPALERKYDPAVTELQIIPQEMGQVFVNLFNNAFDAMQEQCKKDDTYQPKLSVRTIRKQSEVEIHVSDNGPGIPSHIQKRIFDPFFTTKPTGQGTGLGLSLSYDIIQKGHGGSITVASDERRGTTFVITLPAYAQA